MSGFCDNSRFYNESIAHVSRRTPTLHRTLHKFFGHVQRGLPHNIPSLAVCIVPSLAERRRKSRSPLAAALTHVNTTHWLPESPARPHPHIHPPIHTIAGRRSAARRQKIKCPPSNSSICSHPLPTPLRRRRPRCRIDLVFT
jgi:hypothetical protein